MKELLVILAMCTLTAAMIPLERRVLSEEEVARESGSTTTTQEPKKICADETPCGWTTYKPASKVIELNIPNTYCECDVGTVCQKNEDITAAGVYIYRCRPPSDEEES